MSEKYTSKETGELILRPSKQLISSLEEVFGKVGARSKNALAVDLLTCAVSMLNNPSRRVALPGVLVELRQALHGFTDDSYAADSLPAGGVNEFPDDPRVLKAQLEAETAKRELAETRLKLEQVSHGQYPKGEE